MSKFHTIAFWAFVFFFFSLGTCVTCRVVKRQQHNDNLNSLELVHVVFRHGDRTPDKSAIYKNDPYLNVSYYPIGNGQLTNAGKRKEYNIGKDLRERYYDFLAEHFTLDSVDARCTDYNRTKMSLQLVLASLFPPRGHFVWENRLDWQPVPFNYWPLHEDHVLSSDPLKNCPKYKKLFWENLNSTESQQWYENYTELIQYLEHHTGEKMHSKAFADLYFTLTTEKENGYEHPEWAKDVYHHIHELTIRDYNASTATPELKKYAVGFLVKKIIDDSLAKAKGEFNRNTKIYLYSAHEFNIAILLRYLDVFYPHVPPYGSYIIFEVHNIGGIRGIRLYYQDYTAPHPKRLHIPGCGHFCKMKKFIRLYRHMFPVSEKECFENM